MTIQNLSMNNHYVRPASISSSCSATSRRMPEEVPGGKVIFDEPGQSTLSKVKPDEVPGGKVIFEDTGDKSSLSKVQPEVPDTGYVIGPIGDPEPVEQPGGKVIFDEPGQSTLSKVKPDEVPGGKVIFEQSIRNISDLYLKSIQFDKVQTIDIIS